MVEAIGQFGPGFKPPTRYQLSGPLLKEEFDSTKEALQQQQQEWKLGGCSIMTDAWIDRKRRSIMNLCVNCRRGTTFVSSKESSEEAHTGEHIFDYVFKCIEEVGPENVVQVVTDNASNNMAAAKLLKDRMPHIFWSSCATHTINLMLEGIGKIPKFKKTLDSAKVFTIFIYAHHKTLWLMRTYTKKGEIIRPGVTRFASAFLTLQSLVEKKESLRNMFTSTEWENCKWSRTAKGKAAYSTVLNMNFWNGVTLCLKVFAPLVKVLRLVDGDVKPSMGFLYGELKNAKEEIKVVLRNNVSVYRPILDIIDSKAKDRLDTPLHKTAYLLNPFYCHKDPEIGKDCDLMNALYACVEIMYPDDMDKQTQILMNDLVKYTNKEDVFGKPLAKMIWEWDANGTYDLVQWWNVFGTHTPDLKRMAERILALTTSASGCERNWSTFEGIHTKKRNKLDVDRLNNLVFVQFNSKLMNKRKRLMDKKANIDVLLASNGDASNAQGWMVDDGDEEVEPGTGLTWQLVDEATGADEMTQPRRSTRVTRDLGEEFESEDKQVEEDNFEFEADGEQVLERYGEEHHDFNT
ncbi:hypothetical protein ACOSQ3_032529 [Xanthoceras sorbifolium]